MRPEKYLLLIFSLLIFQCSKSPLEKADAAFRKGQFTKAIQAYSQVLKEQPDNTSVKEKIAISYFKLGQEIYSARHAIKAYEARVAQGKKFLSASPTAEVKNLLSDIYLELALAYRSSTPENVYQKKTFFNKALEYLQTSLSFNHENRMAKTALTKFENEHFQEMFDMGMKYYQRGSGDQLNYILADYYFSIAHNLKPADSETRKYLNSGRKKALNVLDPNQRAPIAITDRSWKNNYLAFFIVIHNVDLPSLSFKPENFVLLSTDGSEITGEGKEMFESFLRPANLKRGEETEGVVAFRVKGGKIYNRLEFRVNAEVLSYKNLPL